MKEYIYIKDTRHIPKGTIVSLAFDFWTAYYLDKGIIKEYCREPKKTKKKGGKK